MVTSDVSDTDRETPRSAREIAVGVREEVPERLRAADAWVREQAKRQPMVAMGAALAAGFALGRLLARR